MKNDYQIVTFKDRKIRRQWDEKEEKWYFSVIDVIEALTDSTIPKRYWSDLKNKLKNEGSQVYEKIVQLKFIASERWKVKIDSEVIVQPQSPVGEPCLQIIDYMNWAIQRAYVKNEDRYLKFVEEKISFLVDIYDTDKYPKNFYNRRNKFDLIKISPL